MPVEQRIIDDKFSLRVFHNKDGKATIIIDPHDPNDMTGGWVEIDEDDLRAFIAMCAEVVNEMTA